MNGVNRVVNALANAQAELGYDVEVWGITGDPKSEVPKQKYKLELFQSNNSKFSLHPSVKKAYEDLKGEDVIVHIHGTFIFEFVWIGKLLRKIGVPYCITTHGTFNVRALAKGATRKKWFFRLLDKGLVKGSKFMHFIGLSEFDAFELKVKGHRKALIPNGMDLSEVDFDYQNKKESNEFVFGFCGRMKRNVKGLDLMLSGFRKFLDHEKVNAKLWFLGNGDERAEVEQIVKDLNLDDDVKFWGGQFGGDKFNLLANMDVFLHTSRYEGMPTAVLEAAALGLPSLVSKETNVGAYLEDYKCGYLMPDNTPDEIAKGMKAMMQKMQSEEAKVISENCKVMLAEVFDWKKIAEQLYLEYGK